MSYCRFSKTCDVYLYCNFEGEYIFSVAGPGQRLGSSLRYLFKKPRWFWYRASLVHEIASDFVTKLIGCRKPIGPYDYSDHQKDTIDEAVVFLQELESLGYNFPSYAMEGLEDELFHCSE